MSGELKLTYWRNRTTGIVREAMTLNCPWLGDWEELDKKNYEFYLKHPYGFRLCPKCEGDGGEGVSCICGGRGRIRVPDVSKGERYDICAECFTLRIIKKTGYCRDCDAKMDAMAREHDGEE